MKSLGKIEIEFSYCRNSKRYQKVAITKPKTEAVIEIKLLLTEKSKVHD